MIREIFALILCAGMVSAYATTYNVRDYNTLQPIENVNITLYNDTFMNWTLSDTYGDGAIDADASDYLVRMSRSGYHTYDGYLNVTNDTFKQVYLNPSSTEGIIRISMSDLTLAGDHQSCFYFTNGRLQGCYSINDTVTLHTNMNYTWSPKVKPLDAISSSSSIAANAYRYMGPVLGMAIGAMLLGLIVAIFVYVAFGGKTR